MVALRRTGKLDRLLPRPSEVTAVPDSALGDWYVTRVVVERQPVLVLISSRSLLPIVTPARDVRALPDILPALVGQRLKRLGFVSSVVEREVEAMNPVTVARTIDRSVVGILTNFASSILYYVDDHPTARDWLMVEDRLAETPCFASRTSGTIFPVDRTLELLAEKWMPNL